MLLDVLLRFEDAKFQGALVQALRNQCGKIIVDINRYTQPHTSTTNDVMMSGVSAARGWQLLAYFKQVCINVLVRDTPCRWLACLQSVPEILTQTDEVANKPRDLEVIFIEPGYLRHKSAYDRVPRSLLGYWDLERLQGYVSSRKRAVDDEQAEMTMVFERDDGVCIRHKDVLRLEADGMHGLVSVKEKHSNMKVQAARVWDYHYNTDPALGCQHDLALADLIEYRLTERSQDFLHRLKELRAKKRLVRQDGQRWVPPARYVESQRNAGECC